MWVGEFTKNQFNIEWGLSKKKGARTVCRFGWGGGGLRKKEGVFFWGEGVNTTMHTMYNPVLKL